MYDVVIIGLGVIGCACARELARYKLDILGIDRMSDVAEGTSKANTAAVHSGYDAKPGTLKAKYNIIGNRMFEALSRELDFPFRRLGSMTICLHKEDHPKIVELYERGLANGVPDLHVITGREAHELDPNLTPNIHSALLANTCGVTCPYEMTIALAENARQNGVRFGFETEVRGIVRKNGYFEIETNTGTIKTRSILNAAGIYADKIHNMLCAEKITIVPRKGEYWLLDNQAGQLFSHFIFNLPSEMGKGSAIGCTVSGNLFIGPTAYDIEDKEDTATTRWGLHWVFDQTEALWPGFPRNRFITEFAGLRAHPTTDDFVLGEAEDVPLFFDAAGIESPGLTCAPALGQELASKIVEALGAEENKDFNPNRSGIKRFALMDEREKREAIAHDPRYSNIVCRCEQVSEAEVVEAIRRGATTLDGVKRRTRAGMGKCQGGFCTPELVDILSRELHVPKLQITKKGKASPVLTGTIQ